MSKIHLSDEAVKGIMKVISLTHYTTAEIKDNWSVYLGDHMIGQVHDCDGIGGEIGEWTDSALFDAICSKAKVLLDVINKVKPNPWFEKFQDEAPEVKIHESIHQLKAMAEGTENPGLDSIADLLQSALDELEKE